MAVSRPSRGRWRPSPLQIATTDLPTIMDVAWCHLLVNRRRFLDAVDQMTVIGRTSGDVTPQTAARMAMLRAIAATVRGEWDEGAALAERSHAGRAAAGGGPTRSAGSAGT